jgi:ketosteroid isomerase-like protein
MKRSTFPTPQDAEAAFYEALEKGDLEAMMTVWSDEEDIICIHPGGPRMTGPEQVRESWRQIFSGGQKLRFQLQLELSISSVALVMHSVYEKIVVVDEGREMSPVIATNIYMRSERGWRMVMHHASPAPQLQESNSKRAPKILH